MPWLGTAPQHCCSAWLRGVKESLTVWWVQTLRQVGLGVYGKRKKMPHTLVFWGVRILMGDAMTYRNLNFGLSSVPGMTLIIGFSLGKNTH